MSIGDLATGNTERAGERWKNYAKESVIGSSICAVGNLVTGNVANAKEYGKGFGRAYGQALLGGGVLDGVPVFHEFATAGKSFGDLLGGDGLAAAKKRWDDYSENSVIGSTMKAAVEGSNGNTKRRNELLKNAGKAMLSSGMTIGTSLLTLATGGVAAPLGTAAAVAGGAGAGAAFSVASATVDHFLYDEGEMDKGAMVGVAITGGVAGGFGGYRQAKAFQKASLARMEAEKLKKTAKQIRKDSTKNPSKPKKTKNGKVTHCNIIGEDDGNQSNPIEGYGYATDEPPAGHCGCAESFALDDLEKNDGEIKAKTNYAVEYLPEEGNVVADPCQKCTDVGTAPFAKYKGQKVDDAIRSHIGEAEDNVKWSRRVAALASAGATELAKNLSEMPPKYIVYMEMDVPEGFVEGVRIHFKHAQDFIRGDVVDLERYIDGIDGIIRVSTGKFNSNESREFLKRLPRALGVIMLHLNCDNFDGINGFMIEERAQIPSLYGICKTPGTTNREICHHSLMCLDELCQQGRNSYRRKNLLKSGAGVQ
jgi:hypothetical protein